MGVEFVRRGELLLGSGEVFWEGLGDIARGEILERAGDDGLEAEAVEGGAVGIARPDVAHGGDDDAAFSEGFFVSDGLVFSGAALLGIGVGGGEDVEVIGGATEAVVELVLCMAPLRREAAHDGVLAGADSDSEGMLRAVAGALVGITRDGFAGPGIDLDDLTEIFSTPAEADHFIVVIPAGEGVVCGVDGKDATACADVGGEVFAELLGPIGAIVVEDDGIVLREVDGPFLPVSVTLGGAVFLEFLEAGLGFFVGGEDFGAFGAGLAGSLREAGVGGGGDGGLEAAGGIEGGAEGLGGADPVVVIAAIDDEDAELGGGGFFFGSRGPKKCGQCGDEGEEEGLHGVRVREDWGES